MSIIPTRPHNQQIPLGDWCNANGRAEFQVSIAIRSTETAALKLVAGDESFEPALLEQSIKEIEAAGFRFCSSCHRYLSIDAFHKRSDTKRGVRYECAICRARNHNRKLEFKRRRHQ